mgnify:CR=1 FL=1
MEDQENQWIEHTKTISVEDVVLNYNNPKAHQVEFSNLVNALCESKDFNKVVEVGCETGVNCMLLDNKLDKYFFDLNPDAVKLAEDSVKAIGLKGHFVQGDMFAMPFESQSFDLIFNSGVVEHFTYEERVKFLTEYSRVLKNGGSMLLAYPNHYSFLYRTAYVILKKLLFGFKWPWPKEYKFYDMRSEIEQVGLVLKERKIIARNTFFDGLGKYKPIQKLLLAFDKIFNFEGYLVVLEVEKPLK